ncbi:hypothetical protein HN51_058444 [Arachis hypogaea]
MAINNVATKLFLCIFFVASLSASTLDARGGIMYRTINDAVMFCIQGQCHAETCNKLCGSKSFAYGRCTGPRGCCCY